MREQRTGDWQLHEESAVGRLAQFFPDAAPVCISVTVSRDGGGNAEWENTVIEFGTPREALFACRQPLEFADKLQLRNADGSFEVEAWVVALQYHKGQSAVAARFVERIPHWVVKL
ncbi:MAG: hypothetical protein ACM3PW_05945 [Chlamydiota bacterium]